MENAGNHGFTATARPTFRRDGPDHLAAKFAGGAAEQEELAALTKRLDALRRVEQRLRSQRPANSVDRAPNLPS